MPIPPAKLPWLFGGIPSVLLQRLFGKRQRGRRLQAGERWASRAPVRAVHKLVLWAGGLSTAGEPPSPSCPTHRYQLWWVNFNERKWVNSRERQRIRAVVRMTTELPKPILELFKGKEAQLTATFNGFAALGALTSERGNVYIGSRLTIYEAEDAWRTLHLPLLLFNTIGGTEAILGGIRRTFTSEGQRGGDSQWADGDMEQVQRMLAKLCVCTTGGLGLTAEFGLTEGAVSAAAGDHKTALFQLMADQPHPELGGGLFCLLQMPHQLSDEKRLQQVCMQLNYTCTATPSAG